MLNEARVYGNARHVRILPFFPLHFRAVPVETAVQARSKLEPMRSQPGCTKGNPKEKVLMIVAMKKVGYSKGGELSTWWQLGMQDRQQIGPQRPTPLLSHCGLPNNKEKLKSRRKEPMPTVIPSVYFWMWCVIYHCNNSQILIVDNNPNLTLNMPRNASH